MDAKEYFKQISPNDWVGLRHDLQTVGRFKVVLDIMERYAEYKFHASQQMPSEEEIRKEANDQYGCSGTQSSLCMRDVNIFIKGATWLKSLQQEKSNQ